MILDVRINRTRFEDFKHYFADSGYVDGQTRRVAMELALFNEESAHLVLARIVGLRRDEGGFAFESEVKVLDVLFPLRLDLRMVVEVLYFLALIFSIFTEFVDLRREVKEAGDGWGGVRRAARRRFWGATGLLDAFAAPTRPRRGVDATSPRRRC